MHIFINSLAASAGGGLTYIRNVLPQLSARSGVRVSVAMTTSLRQEFGKFSEVDFLDIDIPVGRRFWYEQSVLPDLVRRSRADVLLSTGNFAIRRSPVPQLLLSRNSIYVSRDYYRDLLSRGEYALWFNTKLRSFLARRSIRWADLTVAPSESFATDLHAWTGCHVLGVHHGFDIGLFTQDSTPLSLEVLKKLDAADEAIKLLFVSHYNYYRNFETLVRALPLLRERFAGQSVRLLLTCHLRRNGNFGGYRTSRIAKQVIDLGISDMIVELGAVPYSHLHQLYGRADLYVSPAYTETFAHPLVEAMAMGVPVVASDIPVHREICGDAALYFSKFSHEELAEKVHQVLVSVQMRRMAESGRSRAEEFSWQKHVEQILMLCESLIAKTAPSLNSHQKGATPL